MRSVLLRLGSRSTLPAFARLAPLVCAFPVPTCHFNLPWGYKTAHCRAPSFSRNLLWSRTRSSSSSAAAVGSACVTAGVYTGLARL